MDPYFFDIYAIMLDDIKRLRSPLKHVMYSMYRSNAAELKLCLECHNFLCKGEKKLDREAKSWVNVWPAFYWNVLTGKDSRNSNLFTDIYSPQYLWKFIPESLRGFWRDSVTLQSNQYDFVTSAIEPASHFSDRTINVNEFWDNTLDYTSEGMLKALDPDRLQVQMISNADEHVKKSMMIPDILCPLGLQQVYI